MNQTPMTTREAVRNLCVFFAEANGGFYEKECHLCRSVESMCEAYNFKLSDFFDNVPVVA